MSRTGASSVEVFADLACPFTHVGLRRFAARRAEIGREDLRLVVRSWPLEIVNGAPFDPLQLRLKILAIRSQVEPELFSGFGVESFPATVLPAMALEAAARLQGPEVGEAVSFELRELLFERGVDISLPEVLEELARRYGIELGEEAEAAVLADLWEGRARGVIGSPHFFTADGDFFCPSLEILSDPAGGMHLRLDLEGFDAFFGSCLG